MSGKALVYLVDDDPAVRKSLTLALELAGYEAAAFGSAEEFFRACEDRQPGCVVLDLRMPGMDGLGLQQALKDKGCHFPLIFISGDGTVPATVRAVKGGAVDFLEKPFATDTLVARIEEALAEGLRQRAQMAEERQVRQRFAQLTPREREVMRLATEGQSNKAIARSLTISPRTVENHRARVMEKMQANNLAELCHMAAICPELKGEISA